MKIELHVWGVKPFIGFETGVLTGRSMDLLATDSQIELPGRGQIVPIKAT